MKTVREMIEEILINPVLSNRPKSYSVEDFLSEIFCLHTRPIGRYHSQNEVEITGHKIEGNIVSPSATFVIYPPTHIIARMDDTLPHMMELECEHGVIRIDIDQWDRVKTRFRKGQDQDEV